MSWLAEAEDSHKVKYGSALTIGILSLKLLGTIVHSQLSLKTVILS